MKFAAQEAYLLECSKYKLFASIITPSVFPSGSITEASWRVGELEGRVLEGSWRGGELEGRGVGG